MVLNKDMAWALLLACSLIEVVWALSIKYTEGFTKLMPTVICLGLSAFNIFLLSIVFKTLPVNISYTIWMVLGVVGTVIGSYYLFGEKINLHQGLFMVLAVVGIIGLKVTTQG